MFPVNQQVNSPTAPRNRRKFGLKAVGRSEHTLRHRYLGRQYRLASPARLDMWRVPLASWMPGVSVKLTLEHDDSSREGGEDQRGQRRRLTVRICRHVLLTG